MFRLRGCGFGLGMGGFRAVELLSGFRGLGLGVFCGYPKGPST